MSRAILRGQVYWVNLDPTIGTEIQKIRPALVVSPDDMNAALHRVIIAPIASAGQPLGCRPEVLFQKKNACILLDQLRCVDKARLGKKIEQIDEKAWHPVLSILIFVQWCSDLTACADIVAATATNGK